MPAQATNSMANSHQPDARLISYMRKRPQFIKTREDLKSQERKLRSKRLLSAKEERQLKDIAYEVEGIDGKLKSLANDKTKILNELIFPSVANLTFFFEAVSMIPELEANFGKDIREMLGIRRHDPNLDNYAFMFVRLVSSIISTDKKSVIEDFTLRLTHLLQTVVARKLDRISLLRTERATTKVLEDIDRALAWTELIASRVNDEYDLMRAIPNVDFNNKEVLEHIFDIKKKTKEEFDEYSRKNLPSRTFDFDTAKLLSS